MTFYVCFPKEGWCKIYERMSLKCHDGKGIMRKVSTLRWSKVNTFVISSFARNHQSSAPAYARARLQRTDKTLSPVINRFLFFWQLKQLMIIIYLREMELVSLENENFTKWFIYLSHSNVSQQPGAAPIFKITPSSSNAGTSLNMLHRQ